MASVGVPPKSSAKAKQKMPTTFSSSSTAYPRARTSSSSCRRAVRSAIVRGVSGVRTAGRCASSDGSSVTSSASNALPIAVLKAGSRRPTRLNGRTCWVDSWVAR